jgi:hypothetical protein
MTTIISYALLNWIVLGCVCEILFGTGFCVVAVLMLDRVLLSVNIFSFVSLTYTNLY